MIQNNFKNLLRDKIKKKKAKIAIIGLGYVGLPLAKAFCKKNIKVVGLDIDESKIEHLNSGKSYIEHIPDKDISQMINKKLFLSSTDFSLLKEVDAIIIC